MVARLQMSMNEQALKNARWIKPENAEEGYCFVKGKGGLVFSHEKRNQLSFLLEVDERSSPIAGGSRPNSQCEIFVFSPKKKYA